MGKKNKEDREVIVVPCSKSAKMVFDFNIYICPSKRNHTETTYFAPYVKQNVERYAKIKHRIREVKFVNPKSLEFQDIDTSSSRFEGEQTNQADRTLINDILKNAKIKQAIAEWYKSEKAWEGDRVLDLGIQVYLLDEWEMLDAPLRPIDVSQNRFQGQRYATKDSLLNSKHLDTACNLPPFEERK